MSVHELSRTEFEHLWAIAHLGKSDPERACEYFSEPRDEAERIFLRLGSLGLIKVEHRDGELYSAIETPAGEAVLRDPAYAGWIESID